MTREESDKIMGDFMRDKLNIIPPQHMLDDIWEMQGYMSIDLGHEITAKTLKAALDQKGDVNEYFKKIRRSSSN